MPCSQLLTLEGLVASSLRGVISRTSESMHDVIALESRSEDEDETVVLEEDDV